MKDRRDLARGWLAKANSDLVTLRYDFDFWPDRPTAEDALKAAREVWRLVLDALPEDCWPQQA